MYQFVVQVNGFYMCSLWPYASYCAVSKPSCGPGGAFHSLEKAAYLQTMCFKSRNIVRSSNEDDCIVRLYNLSRWLYYGFDLILANLNNPFLLNAHRGVDTVL